MRAEEGALALGIPGVVVRVLLGIRHGVRLNEGYSKFDWTNFA